MVNNELTPWLKIYYNLLSAEKSASFIMLIYNIESTRKDKTDGIMNIDIVKQYLLQYILPTDLYQHIVGDFQYWRLIIKFINHDLYDVTIRNLTDVNIKTTMNFILLKNMLIKSMYSTFSGDAISIRDSDHISYYLTLEGIRINIANHPYLVNTVTMYRRLSIIDTHYYLSNNII